MRCVCEIVEQVLRGKKKKAWKGEREGRALIRGKRI
jgi:hypothetical protein